jgi:CubicO group peptidase (beta-lactamase class C family)
MSKFKKIILSVFTLLVVANIAILISGKTYLYKTILYNFPNIDDNKIFEQRQIKAGIPQEWPLGKDYNNAELPKETTALHKKLNSIAFLIIKNDSIRFEKYWEGYNQKSLSNSFSMAKTFVGIMIGVAIDEGKIKSIDEPVANYLSSFKEGDKAKITIKDVLTMSSGINWDESYVNPLSMTTEAYYGSDLTSIVDRFSAVDKPGKTFKYLSGNTLILSMILEKATGKHISNYFSEKIWQPIGASLNAEWSIDKKDGEEKAYCCVYSNARDFARLGELYLNKGNWHGQQLVSEIFVENSVKAANLVDADGKKIDFYGYAWWLLPNYKGHNVFYARGILGQYIIVIPDEKMVIVRLGEKRGEKIGVQVTDLASYIDAALEMYK